MSIKLLLIFTVLLIFTEAKAQNSETIATGRPGVSIGAGVLGSNVFQVQSGLEFNSQKDRGTRVEQLYLNTVARYGISKRFEVSTLFDINNINKGSVTEGNIQFGGRFAIIESHENYIPMLALQYRAQLQDSQGQSNSDINNVFILSSNFKLSEQNYLTVNSTFSDIAHGNVLLTQYTIAWDYALNEKWTPFIEFYATRSSQWSKAWDTGFGYLVHKDLAIDFSIGFDLESNYENQFVSTGFSWRTY